MTYKKVIRYFADEKTFLEKSDRKM